MGTAMKDKMLDNLQERFASHEVPVDPGAWNAISGQLAVASGAALSNTLQKKFAGHEAAVDPHVWANISSQLGHGAAAGTVASTGWWAAGIAATVLVGGLLFWTLNGTGASAPVQELEPTAQTLVVPDKVAAIAVPQPGSTSQIAHTEPTIAVSHPASGAAPKQHLVADASLVSGHADPQVDPGTTANTPPETEGERVRNAVLQQLVNANEAGPISKVKEEVPPPTQKEMPVPEVHPATPPAEHTEDGDETLPLAVQSPEPNIFIPNVFSPQGDGINDKLQVAGSHYQKVDVRIFSAHSNALVFRADNLDAAWNGRDLNNVACEEGYYFYAIEVVGEDGRTYSKGETVRLFR